MILRRTPVRARSMYFYSSSSSRQLAMPSSLLHVFLGISLDSKGVKLGKLGVRGTQEEAP